MADANSAAEQIKLLTDIGKTDNALEAMRNETSQNLAQLRQMTQEQEKQSRVTQSEQKAQLAQQEKLAQAEQSGSSFLNNAVNKLNLTEDQMFLSQQSGELSATLRYQLKQDLDKELKRNSAGSDDSAAIQSALGQLGQYEQAFKQANPTATDPSTISDERKKDLATPDGFWGNVVKGAATGVAGIPGLAGIAASAAGFEDAGQLLGGLASGIRDAAPTDIGSSAANQQFADILSRAEGGELSTTDAIKQAVQLGLTDGDFAADLLGSTVGAAAGGGVVRGAANAAGITARLASAAPSTTTAAGRLIAEAGRTAPAIGVGLGAGVDENLTSGQARILAGTGVASSLTAGATGLLGARVAESALGNVAARIPGAQRLGASPAPAAGTLRNTTALGQLGAAGRGALGTGAAEAAQEFVEGAGESLGQTAQTTGQGALETLGDADARRRAITSGAIQAPLGAGLGGPIGAASGVASARAANNQQGRLQDEAAQIDTQRTGDIDGARIAEATAQARQQRELGTTSVEAQELAARQAEANQLNTELDQATQAREETIQARQQELTIVTPAAPLTGEALTNSTRAQRQAANQDTTRPQTLLDFLESSLADPASFDQMVDSQGGNMEDTFRALYRNEAEVNEGLDPAAEQSFIDQVLAIDYDNAPLAEINAQVIQAANDAQLNIPPPATGNEPTASANDPTSGIAPNDAAVFEAANDPANINNQPAANDPPVDPPTPAPSTPSRPPRTPTTPDGTPPPVNPTPPVDPTPTTPTPSFDPDDTAISREALFDITDDGTFISDNGLSRAAAVASVDGAAFQSLDEKTRNRMMEGKPNGKANPVKQAMTRVQKTLEAEPPLTPAEEKQLLTDVTFLEGEVGRKKSEGPDSGVTGTPSFIPMREKPQTASPEFAQFFDGSKVVDESNQPLVLFHGTSRKLEDSAVVDPEGFTVSESGVYFTADSTVAETYATEPLLDRRTDELLGFEQTGSIAEVFLALKNPIIIDAQKASHYDLTQERRRAEGQTLPETDPLLVELRNQIDFSTNTNRVGTPSNEMSIDRIKEAAEKLGYDGAIVRNILDSGGLQDQYIAFSPTQIKSATDNSGAFNPTNPDVRSSRKSAPNPALRKTQGFVGPARVPAPSGLLPDAGVSTQVQQFTPQTLKQGVAKLTAGWKRNPDIQIVNSTQDLPEGIRPTDGSLVAGRTNGKTVYLVADQIVSEADLESVLREELFHRGIRNSLGGNYDPQLRRFFTQRGGVDGMLKLAKKYKLPTDFITNYQDVIANAQRGDRNAQLELVDEVLARVAQSPDLPSGLQAVVKKITTKIKRYLKQFMPKEWFDTISDNDLLLMMREAEVAGRVPGESSNTLRSSVKRPGDYRGTNPAGEQVVYNYLDGSERSETSLAQDQVNFAQNLWTGLSDSYAGNGGLGNMIYRSSAWQGLKKRLSDGRVAAQVHENEYRQAAPEAVSSMVSAVNATEMPSMLRDVAPTTDSEIQNTLSVHSALSTYVAQALDAAKRTLKVGPNSETMFELMAELNDAQATYAALIGKNQEEANQSSSMYSLSLHASERNDITYLKNGKLDEPFNAQRASLFEQVAQNTLSMADALAQAKTLMDTHALEERADHIGAGMTDAAAAEVRERMESDPDANVALTRIVEAQQAVLEGAKNVRRKTGSYSRKLDETIKAYGWKNYVPLRGSGVDLDSEDSALSSRSSNAAFAASNRPMQGRESLTEDVFNNVLAFASGAIEEYGAQEVIKKVAWHGHAANVSEQYRQVFDKDGLNGRLFAASIQQVDLNSKAFDNAMSPSPFQGGSDPLYKRNLMVLYDPNNEGSAIQKALIVKMEAPNGAGADAILGARSESAEAVDDLLKKPTINGVGLHQATQTLASLKTARNPPFIPFDALRNMFTLGYDIRAQKGGEAFKKYVDVFTTGGLNYGKDILAYSRLYGNGEFDKIADLVAAAGPSSNLAELDEFFRLGGPTSQMAALFDAPPGTAESLERYGGIGDTSLMRKFDRVIMPLNVAGDTLSRFAYYKALKETGITKEVAAARAKNTSNFEQRGTWSGPLGALFEFARPTAVGATALIDSVLTGDKGAETAALAFGTGASLYMVASLFAGTDDDDVDNQGKINGKLFNNNFVIQYGDDPSDRVQFGLGFGPIAASMSAGIQAMRFGMGHQSLNDTFDNMISGTANQYTVLPLSGISPLGNPFAFVSNTVTPSLLKPLFEVNRNLTGLGLPVRSDYPGADSGDLTESFEGRYRSEQEMYESVTQALRNTGFAEINPDNLKHIMRGYGGTITHLLESGFENIKYATKDEDYAYDYKAGFYFSRNFVGSTFSQTPAEGYKLLNRVAVLDGRAKKFDKAGSPDKADQIRDTEFYANNIEAYKDVNKGIKAINKRESDLLRADGTPLAQKRNALKGMDVDKYYLFKDFLENARD